MRFLPCGDAAFLVEVDDFGTALRLENVLADNDLTASVVLGARTVLVRLEPGQDVARFAGWLDGLDVPDEIVRSGHDVTIPVVYDGADLDDVAELTGLTCNEVVELHQATAWQVAFIGFAPGFGYLVGGEGSLAVPRRPESRIHVPAGAVGLAGEFTGVYPRASPGGWQLIGRTDAVVWDPNRRRPALLAPGNRVRFEAVRG